ncbi:MAG TPA: prepilin-type N-terminal cleavage/methylation domain-containing protein [Solirubrobacteraceae bacterium]|nr:prepilin-type N-terminal cleavage/methylation domain-containing protein [Solirubrobacteraceae bacterium]
MRPSRPTLASLRRDQHGFTLIETLVAMFSAVVVVGALYAILDVSVQQAARVTDVVQATQIGRTTMTKVVGELHSACIASEFVPIQVGSMETTSNSEAKLVFINAYSKEAEISTAYKHEIVWQKSTGLLVNRTYQSNGGTWPKFTFPATKTETRLGEHIWENPVKGKETEIEPMFQYYKYSKEASKLSSETEGLSTLKQIGLETKGAENILTAKGAEEAAAVEINFRQGPVDKNVTEARSTDLKTLVTLSFSVPNAETPIEAKPCE